MRTFFRRSFLCILLISMLPACDAKPDNSTILQQEDTKKPIAAEASNTPDLAPTQSPVPPMFTPTAAHTPTQPTATSTTSLLTETPSVRDGQIVSLTAIHMLSETEGWGVSGIDVFITGDGGQTWLNVTPPKADGEERFDVYGAFKDPDHAVVLFASIELGSIFSSIAPDVSVWSTVDGGQTWMSSASLNHSIFEGFGTAPCRASFSMVDTQTGWLRVTAWGTAAGAKFSTQFFQTLDGGMTWNVLDTSWCDQAGTCFSNTPGWLSDTVFGNNQTGLQLIDRSNCEACYGSMPAPAYYQTTDGGLTWHLHYLPAPSDNTGLFNQYWACEPSQLNLLTGDSVRLRLACSEKREGQGAVDYLYTSENGGNTWNTHEFPAGAAMSDTVTRMEFFDTDHALLLGRKMWETADGGLTWELMSAVPWEGQFSFADLQNGWAIVKRDDTSILMFTNSGGLEWGRLNPVVIQ